MAFSNGFHWKVNQIEIIFIEKNTFEIVVIDSAAILFQYVETCNVITLGNESG